MKNKVIVNKNYLELLERGAIRSEIESSVKKAISDARYLIPKEKPKASEQLARETIVTTEIYRRAMITIIQSSIRTESKNAILKVQNKQVSYGLDKYPEPLNADTWNISETIDHIMDESIDKVHYLTMLSIKLEQLLISGKYDDLLDTTNISNRIKTINDIIRYSIEELDYLLNLGSILYNEHKANGGNI